jgi:hypothetical protein
MSKGATPRRVKWRLKKCTGFMGGNFCRAAAITCRSESQTKAVGR